MSENLILDTKIMFLRALEPKMELFIHLWATILKIQDGGRSEELFIITIGFLTPENMVIDTKIMSLSGLKLILEGKIDYMAAILENRRFDAFPHLGFSGTFSMSYIW